MESDIVWADASELHQLIARVSTSARRSGAEPHPAAVHRIVLAPVVDPEAVILAQELRKGSM